MRYKNIIPFFILMAFTVSCSDFLEEEPRDSLGVDQYFTEPGQAESAVNYLYQNGVPDMYLSGGVFNGTQIMYLQYVSGFFNNEFNGQERQVDLAQQLLITPNNVDDDLNRMWENLYRGIAGANLAIANIPETPGLTDGERTNLISQAQFFRGFAYFYLVRIFGDVPLILDPIENIKEIYPSRDATAVIYDQIITDLTAAAVPGSLPSGNMVNNSYRITTETVQMILADVYLTMSGFPLQNDNYAKAATAARAVIKSGAFSLTPNERDADGNVVLENSAYNQIRKEQAVGTEYIYQIEYEAGIRSSLYPLWSFPASTSGSVGSAYGNIQNAYGPRPELYDQYDQALDLRVQEKQYFHTTFTTQSGEVITFPITPYIWLDEEAFFTTSQSSKNLRVYSYSEALLVAAEAIALSEGVTAEAVDYVTQVRSRAYWTTDPEIIRAELSGLSVTDFVEEVWTERNRELIFDFKLWFDMIRTRKISEGANGSASFKNLIGSKNSFGKTFEEKNLLLPIAQSETQRNSNLEQNPGY